MATRAASIETTREDDWLLVHQVIGYAHKEISPAISLYNWVIGLSKEGAVAEDPACGSMYKLTSDGEARLKSRLGQEKYEEFVVRCRQLGNPPFHADS